MFPFAFSVYIKKKVKCSRYRPGVAQRVGSGIALLFHVHSTRRGWVVSSTLRLKFTPGKDWVHILQEVGFSVSIYITLQNEYLGIFLSVTENIPTEDRKCIHKSKLIFISWHRIDDVWESSQNLITKHKGLRSYQGIPECCTLYLSTDHCVCSPVGP
jgi:hypothetical protein